MARGSVPKQVFSVPTLPNGTWRVIVDGNNIESGEFNGSWSGEVESKVEFRRTDVPASTQTPEDPPAP